MAGTDFRLHGRSLCLSGETKRVDPAREKLLDLAEADGYELHVLVDSSRKASTRQYRTARALVRERLRQNPELRPWNGDRVLFYDSNIARGTHFSEERRLEVARMMRLSPVTGVVFVLESFGPRTEYAGVRSIHGSHERLKYGWGDWRWVEGVIGEALLPADDSATL